MLQVKNWAKFQHYGQRNPPWIKLQTNVFQDYKFSNMTDASKLLLFCIWTLASRSEDGTFEPDLEYIKKFGMLSSVKVENLKELIDSGFILDNHNLLASSSSSSRGEERREETEDKEPEPKKISFDFSTGKFLNIPQEKILRWKEAYPAIDVISEIRKSAIWLTENPKNKKSNYGKFIAGWLSRSQDKAPKNSKPASGYRMPSPAGG